MEPLPEYINEPFFKGLDPRSKNVLVQNYPTGEFRSVVEYKYYPEIKLVVKNDDGTKSVFYL